MQEQWIRWEPAKGLSSKYCIESILDNLEAFKIVLHDEHDSRKKIYIIFEGFVGSYKWTDETFRLGTVSFLNKQYGTKFYSEWTFFKVINSKYLRLISEESCSISDSRNLIHLVIIESNSILDIIAASEPKIEFVEGK
jgi:hypothetical protein